MHINIDIVLLYSCRKKKEMQTREQRKPENRSQGEGGGGGRAREVEYRRTMWIGKWEGTSTSMYIRQVLS